MPFNIPSLNVVASFATVLCVAVAFTAGCGKSPATSAAPPLVSPPAPRPDNQAILDYAKPVAEAFLGAIKAGSPKAAMDFITKDYERRLRDRLARDSTLDLAFRDAVIFPISGTYGGEESFYKQIAGWEIRSSQVSPDRKEVASEGALKLKDGKEFTFRLLVREETDGSKWRVDAMMLVP